MYVDMNIWKLGLYAKKVNFFVNPVQLVGDLSTIQIYMMKNGIF